MTVPLLHAVACQGGKPAPLEIGTAAAERTERVHRYERTSGAFERTFTLPTTVDASTIKATYEHGVLTVTLPKVEKAKPREIAVPRSRECVVWCSRPPRTLGPVSFPGGSAQQVPERRCDLGIRYGPRSRVACRAQHLGSHVRPVGEHGNALPHEFADPPGTSAVGEVDDGEVTPGVVPRHLPTRRGDDRAQLRAEQQVGGKETNPLRHSAGPAHPRSLPAR